MKKLKLKIAMAAVVAAVAGYVTYQNRAKEISMSELALANVEALAQFEIGSGYCTMHIPCYNQYGSPTGKYSGFSYSGPNCNGAYHSHSCTYCNHA